MKVFKFLTLALLLLLAACSFEASNKSAIVDIKNRSLVNSAANIPSQCYTKTEDESGKVHNPCFNCHISSVKPNYIDDVNLQKEYTFKKYARENHWTNLFKDRTKDLLKISDEEILEYIRESNYFGSKNEFILAEKLKNLPNEWDIDGDSKWDGYIPDCYYNFDNEGFDKGESGEYTGWRAFGYYPFLGTFWPTNGSTDDVLIRLPIDFRIDVNGIFDLEVYKINLLIVEALIKQKNIKTFQIDEVKYGVDLNKDGNFSIANQITFDYDPRNGIDMHYVGMANKQEHKIAAGLYPKGTEFLHAVYYIDIDDNNSIKMASRMKELRYAKKVNWATYTDHQVLWLDELKEADVFPDRLEVFIGDAERGVSNKRGWRYQGFIEDEYGELRPQSYEENLLCIGCHANIGAIADSTFVFQRKFEHESFQNGWYHWTQKDLQGTKEPKTPDGRNEYSLYLKENGAGDEFRENDEVIQKFFNEDGSLKEIELQKLNDDITHLIFPTQQRALNLNKAYKIIVNEQSFVYGRDATISPVKNVHKKLDFEQSTKIDNPIEYSNSKI